MTNNELVGLGISYVYAIGLLVVGELLHRFAGVRSDLTRKLIHIGAGMWVFGILALFERWQVGIIPFATFILVNAALWRYRVVKAMDAADSSPGTVYFAIVITALFALLWRPEGPVDRVAAAAAGIMAMTWGDALAALAGKAFGRRRYTVGRSTRTIEGSAVMLAASFAAMLLTLLLLPGSPLAPLAEPLGAGRALAAAGLGALAVTAAEAVSPHGTDNLSVPLVGAGVVLLVL
jgi:phytol kinase